jgi:hypothetical protein
MSFDTLRCGTVGEVGVSADLYRRYAADCVSLASESGSDATKATLLDMARCWAHLAQFAEKNSHLELVYESPPHVVE